MGIISVIALDPGPATGMCFLDYSDQFQPYALIGKTLLQVDGESAAVVLEGLLRAFYADPSVVTKRFASIEKFVTGQSAGTRGQPAEVTRQLAMELAEVCGMFGYVMRFRSASDVKPWATDKRLKEAGIVGASGIHSKLRDAYDAARHGLFCAVKDAGVRDPLA